MGGGFRQSGVFRSSEKSEILEIPTFRGFGACSTAEGFGISNPQALGARGLARGLDFRVLSLEF